MKKIRKGISFIIALALILGCMQQILVRASENNWKIVKVNNRVFSEIHSFDGERYIGKKDGNWCMADAGMNILFEGSKGRIKEISDGYYSVISEENSGSLVGVIDKEGHYVVPMSEFKKVDIDKENFDDYKCPIAYGKNAEGKIAFGTREAVFDKSGKQLVALNSVEGAKSMEVKFFVQLMLSRETTEDARYIQVDFYNKAYPNVKDSSEFIKRAYYDFDGNLIPESKYEECGIEGRIEWDKGNVERTNKIDNYMDNLKKKYKTGVDEVVMYYVYHMRILEGEDEVQYYYYFDDQGDFIGKTKDVSNITDDNDKDEWYYKSEDYLYYYKENYGVVKFGNNTDIYKDMSDDAETIHSQSIIYPDGKSYLDSVGQKAGYCIIKNSKSYMYDSDGKKVVEFDFVPGRFKEDRFLYGNYYYMIIKTKNGFCIVDKDPDNNLGDYSCSVYDENHEKKLASVIDVEFKGIGILKYHLIGEFEENVNNTKDVSVYKDFYYDYIDNKKVDSYRLDDSGYIGGIHYNAVSDKDTAIFTTCVKDERRDFKLKAPFDVDSWAVEKINDGYVFYGYNKYLCGYQPHKESKKEENDYTYKNPASNWLVGGNMGAQYIAIYDSKGNKIQDAFDEGTLFCSDITKSIYVVNSSNDVKETPASTDKPLATIQPSADNNNLSEGKDNSNANKNGNSKENKNVKVKTVKGIKLTKKGKSGVKVSFKKVKGVSGYVINYAKNKKFTSGSKTIYTSKTKYVIKNLKKTYYIRVRGYISKGGKKIFGKWSGIKKK